ncbi:MAG: M20 family metallopeptidase [Oligoflexia bacterium]|nr:M20 family metallopeptidase [Oligoflexia bacterium]
MLDFKSSLTYLIKKDLKELCSIDSSKNSIEGIAQVQSLYRDRLSKLGMISKLVKGEGDSGVDSDDLQLLICSSQTNHERTISFICHADTVLAPFEVKLEEGKLYGSGVADNKGGALLGVMALEKCYFELSKKFNINFIVSPSEETGSHGFHGIFKEIGSMSHIVLGLEPALSSGELVDSRNGNLWVEIELEGKSGHSGRLDNDYLNAAQVQIEVYQDIQKTLSKFEETTIQITGMSTHNDSYNRVASHSKMSLDIRFNCHKSHSEIMNYFDNLSADSFSKSKIKSKPITIKTKYVDACPPMEKKKDLKFKSLTHTTFKKSGGAADINYFSHESNLCIDGLGPCGFNLHRKDEYIHLNDFTYRLQNLIELLDELSMSDDYKETL